MREEWESRGRREGGLGIELVLDFRLHYCDSWIFTFRRFEANLITSGSYSYSVYRERWIPNTGITMQMLMIQP
jgi:hypothetical protein